MSWYNSNLNKWINWYVENPFKTWWKARKFFKRPRFRLHVSTLFYNCPLASYDDVGRIFELRVCDVGWKDKYNSPRHEHDPYFWVCFFHYFVINITMESFYYMDELGQGQDLNMQYWERLLDFVYYRKRLIQRSAWTYESRLFLLEGKPMHLPIIETGYLTKAGVQRLNDEVQSQRKRTVQSSEVPTEASEMS